MAESHTTRHSQRESEAAHTAFSAPFTPRKVLLFSGHLADAPGRSPPRFPPQLEAAAVARIADTLDALDAGAQDLAITQGASGGDLIFLEACQARGVRLSLMLPLAEPDFIARSILPATNGEAWAERYRRIRTALDEPPHILPPRPPCPATPSTPADNPFARCNRWMLDTALGFGAERLVFICLWNGARGDGPGGTAHMVEAVEHLRIPLHWIDTRTL